METTERNVSPAETPAQSTAPASPADSGSDLESLLAEFDATTAPPEQAERRAPDEIDKMLDKTAGQQQPEAPQEFAQQLGELRGIVEQHELERLQARENGDVQSAIREAGQAIADYADSLPPDYAELFLRSQYQLDPEFAEAWDRRYESEPRREHARKLFNNALGKLTKAASKQHAFAEGRSVHEDRQAIVAAMTRGTNGKAPEAKPRDYSRMSNNEFNDAVEREFGYRANV